MSNKLYISNNKKQVSGIKIIKKRVDISISLSLSLTFSLFLSPHIHIHNTSNLKSNKSFVIGYII